MLLSSLHDVVEDMVLEDGAGVSFTRPSQDETKKWGA